MSRNWGIPSKPGNSTIRQAKNTRPVGTMMISVIFGMIGAMVAGLGFSEARNILSGLFQHKSLIASVVAGAFGAWFYVWLVRPRFAAHFSPGEGDAFSDILRFYAKATLGLFIFLILARLSIYVTGNTITALLLCVVGGGGAAAAFQTVIAFVPGYDQEPGA